MAAIDLLAELQGLGVELQIRGDRLRYRPRSAVTATLRTRLQESKQTLIPLLHLAGQDCTVELKPAAFPETCAIGASDFEPWMTGAKS